MNETILQAVFDNFLDEDTDSEYYGFVETRLNAIVEKSKEDSCKDFKYEVECSMAQVEKKAFYSGVQCAYELLTGRKAVRAEM